MTRRKASTPANNYNAIKPYTQGSYLNAANIKYHPANFLDAALAGTGDAVNGGGPIWAIFDADAVKRENWTVEPPYVDIAEGYFFSANTLAALAAAIVNKHQRKPMPGAALENTVTRYNSFVDAGKMRTSGSPLQSTRSRRRRSTPLGPRPWSTIPERDSASTRNARSWIFPAMSFPVSTAEAKALADSACTAWRDAPCRAASPEETPPPKRPKPQKPEAALRLEL